MWTTLKKRSPHAHSHNKCKCQAQDDIDQEAALSFTSIRPIAHIRRAPPTDSPEEAFLPFCFPCEILCYRLASSKSKCGGACLMDDFRCPACGSSALVYPSVLEN